MIETLGRHNTRLCEAHLTLVRDEQRLTELERSAKRLIPPWSVIGKRKGQLQRRPEEIRKQWVLARRLVSEVAQSSYNRQ